MAINIFTALRQFDDVDTIIKEAGSLFKDVQQFDDKKLDDLGSWAEENTDDRELDIIDM